MIQYDYNVPNLGTNKSRERVSEISEYKVENKEYSSEKKRMNWDMAIGLQDVDRLKPSNYLLELAEKEINGEITNEEIETLLYQKYESEINQESEREKEADIVSNRIKILLEDESFTFSPVTLNNIHRFMFKDIYDHAGQYKTQNWTKGEAILGGETVRYCPHYEVEQTLEYDFNKEKTESYKGLTIKQMMKRITKFTSGIWQIHPFAEGNTRTTAVFIEKYLRTMGFEVDNHLFKENALYFRNALVRNNFNNIPEGIVADDKYLVDFFENLLMKKKNILKNRDMILPKVKEAIKRDRTR